MRLYCPNITAAAHQDVIITKDQANHLKVRRINRGETITVFNEEIGDWAAIVGGDKLLVMQKQIRPPQPVPDVWIVQPLLAKDRFALVTEKITELGAAAFYPVTTRYTQGSQMNAERTQQHLIEAAQQCERTAVPRLEKLQSLTQLLRNWPDDRVLFVALEREDPQPLKRVLAAHAADKVAFLTGPEGGFDAEEKQLLLAHPHVKAFSLGPRILRAETAIIGALSVWQATRGDWQ